MPVRISSESLQRIIAHAAKSPMLEVCGLLVGTAGAVHEVISAGNVADRPSCAFEIDPTVLVSTHRATRRRGLSVIGCYHSHPNGRAEPSPIDVASAQPGQLWLIVVNDAVAAFRMRAGGYDLADLIVAALPGED